MGAAWHPADEQRQSKFESLYVFGFGFAHPTTGRTCTLVLPKANAVALGQARTDFARWADPDWRKVLVRIPDDAGFHRAGALAVPANVVLHHLPNCTPELQPVEPLWPLVREGLANQAFPTLPALEVPLRERLRWLADHPDTVKGAVGFHRAVALG